MPTTSSVEDIAKAASTFVELFEQLDLGEEQADEALTRMLTINSEQSHISSSSTLAVEEKATQPSSNVSLNRIGAGICGEVFEAACDARVYKRAFPRWDTDLRFDHTMHHACITAFEKHAGEGLQIYVPQLYRYIDTTDDGWWGATGRALPKTSERRSVLVSERIYPLPHIMRMLLIQRFCDPNEKDTVVHNAENRDALVRIYLGRQGTGQFPPQFSLRNFELTLVMMNALGLPKLYFAKLLGQALAIIHWEAKVDGRDIEFVLGSAPAGTVKLWTMKFSPGEEAPYTERELDSTRRFIRIWVLDFNQCRQMSMDEAGCQQAALAFWDNDPYYPRPTNNDEQEMWKYFAHCYLDQASRVLVNCRDDIGRLPGFFISRVKAIGDERFPTGSENKQPPPQGPPKGSPGGVPRPSGRAKKKGALPHADYYYLKMHSP